MTHPDFHTGKNPQNPLRYIHMKHLLWLDSKQIPWLLTITLAAMVFLLREMASAIREEPRIVVYDENVSKLPDHKGYDVEITLRNASRNMLFRDIEVLVYAYGSSEPGPNGKEVAPLTLSRAEVQAIRGGEHARHEGRRAMTANSSAKFPIGQFHPGARTRLKFHSDLEPKAFSVSIGFGDDLDTGVHEGIHVRNESILTFVADHYFWVILILFCLYGFGFVCYLVRLSHKTDPSSHDDHPNIPTD